MRELFNDPFNDPCSEGGCGDVGYGMPPICWLAELLLTGLSEETELAPDALRGTELKSKSLGGGGPAGYRSAPREAGYWYCGCCIRRIGYRSF